MQLLDGTLTPDAGEVVRQTRRRRSTRLEQDVPDDVAGSIFDVVAEGLGETGRLLARYHHASHRVAAEQSDGALRELNRLHQALDAADAWQVQSRVEHGARAPRSRPRRAVRRRIGRAQAADAARPRARAASPTCCCSTSRRTTSTSRRSSGWSSSSSRRARRPTLLFVTHDRAFLRRVATRIVELDRGQSRRLGRRLRRVPRAQGRRARAGGARPRGVRQADRARAGAAPLVDHGAAHAERGARPPLDAMRRERAAWREREGTMRLQAVGGASARGGSSSRRAA